VAEAPTAELAPELAAWIEGAAGAKPLSARAAPAGGSRSTLLVDARRPDGSPLALVVRLEGGGSHSGTSFSLEREYRVYRALEGRGVPVPKAYDLLPDGSALLMERLEGTAEFRAMSAADQVASATRFMEALGRLHALEARELTLPGFDLPTSAVQHATIELDRWEILARGSCWDEPLARYAFGFLRARAPRTVQRTVLVHGDAGPGNFMATSDRITGLIDWEFCHIGDPMDDFGWLHSRSRGLMGLFEAAYPSYEAASGLQVDPPAVAYYHQMAILRCVVTVALGKLKGGALGVIPYRHVYRNYLARLADLLVEGEGLAVEPDELAGADGPTSPLFSEARSELRNHVLPDGISRRARTATQAALIALTALELRERFGAEVAARNEADRRALLGAADPADLAEAAAQAGASGEPKMLALLARCAWRERKLWPR